MTYNTYSRDNVYFYRRETGVKSRFLNNLISCCMPCVCVCGTSSRARVLNELSVSFKSATSTVAACIRQPTSGSRGLRFIYSFDYASSRIGRRLSNYMRISYVIIIVRARRFRIIYTHVYIYIYSDVPIKFVEIVLGIVLTDFNKKNV